MSEIVTEKTGTGRLAHPPCGGGNKILARETGNAGKTLRIFVEQGGCSGMQYGLWSLMNATCDQVAEQHGVTLPRGRLQRALSARAPWWISSDSLTGGGFKISNPNAKQNCGCGKSFEA